MSWSTAACVVAAILATQAAHATTLTFDEHSHNTALSSEYSSSGVLLSSTAPIGPGASSDPADTFQPGQSVAAFVFAIVAVPSSSTPSPPNKVIGAVVDVGGSLLQCERCGIRISFLDPIPTEVSFFITDPDFGQSARFFGPGGLLSSVTLAPPSSNFPEFVSFNHASGITEILLVSAPSVGIGFDNLQFSSPVPEPGTVALLSLALLPLGRRALYARRRPTSGCS